MPQVFCHEKIFLYFYSYAYLPSFGMRNYNEHTP